jgi:hypothetical protein
VKITYAGAKLRAQPKPKAKAKLQLTARIVGQSRSAPLEAPVLASQTRSAAVRKPEAAAATAPVLGAASGGGSSFALWFLIGLGCIGGLLIAGAALPAHALASFPLHRRLAERRVDVAMTGATMLGCLLVLLALAR